MTQAAKRNVVCDAAIDERTPKERLQTLDAKASALAEQDRALTASGEAGRLERSRQPFKGRTQEPEHLANAVALFGLLIAVAILATSGGRVCLRPLFFFLPLGGMLGHWSPYRRGDRRGCSAGGHGLTIAESLGQAGLAAGASRRLTPRSAVLWCKS